MSTMDKTITKIKTLKNRRKLSLPATSPLKQQANHSSSFNNEKHNSETHLEYDEVGATKLEIPRGKPRSLSPSEEFFRKTSSITSSHLRKQSDASLQEEESDFYSIGQHHDEKLNAMRKSLRSRGSSLAPPPSAAPGVAPPPGATFSLMAGLKGVNSFVAATGSHISGRRLSNPPSMEPQSGEQRPFMMVVAKNGQRSKRSESVSTVEEEALKLRAYMAGRHASLPIVVVNNANYVLTSTRNGASFLRESPRQTNKPPPTPPCSRTPCASSDRKNWDFSTSAATSEANHRILDKSTTADSRGGLSHQLSSASTHSLPSRIDHLTDCEDDYEDDSSSALDIYDESASNSPVISASSVLHEIGSSSDVAAAGPGHKYSRASHQFTSCISDKSSHNSSRRGNKLKRRKAYYHRQRKDVSGRSKSLTSIDTLEPSMSGGSHHQSKLEPRSAAGLDLDCSGRLSVPIRSENASVDHSPTSPGFYRRRKLSTASKVSSSEFFTVYFECIDDLTDRGGGCYEEFVPATRGTCLREAISAVCERRGVDVDSINVYLEQSRTPLPLLTTETAWLGGRHIRVRAKDDSKSPVRGGGRISVTAPPSRKTSAANNSYRSKSKLFSPSVSTSDDVLQPSLGSGSSPGHHQPPLSQSLSVGGLQSATPTLAALHANSCGSPSLGGSKEILGNSTEGSLKVGKSGKPANRWSGLWGSSSKDTKMDLLVTHLDTYSRLGIPKLHHLVAFEAEDEVEEALYSLEEDWTEIVQNSHSLSEKGRNQQTALWELVETEVAYIRTLKVIQDLFLNCLCNLQNNMVLTEIDTEKLFCNIPEIYAANRVFWHDYIMPMLTVSRETGEPLNPILMKEGFLRFEVIFNPYSRYCSEQTNCQEYCKEQDRNSEVFKAYLAWCETQKDCNRLRLIDILVRPMQRLTKYSLLLKAILKKTEDEVQQDTLKSMAKKVESFVSHVNSHLRQRQENERLNTIIARIDSYEPVETKDEDLEKLVQSHCRLDLTAPMPGCSANHQRNLLFEGDLKLKEGTSSKMDVHAFLFSDMLLLCKVLTKKSHSSNPEARMKIIRQPFIVDRLLVSEINKDNQSLAVIYLNEYHVASAAFTLHSTEAKVLKVWKEQISKAKEIYETAKNHSRYYWQTQYSAASADGDEEAAAASSNHYLSSAPVGQRKGSLRGSRISSVAHSHSGSMDLMEVGSLPNPGFRRDVSLELSHGYSVGSVATEQNRASSLSSEEGGHQQQNNSLEVSSSSAPPPTKSQSSYPSSPRAERRAQLIKGNSPNTLTVQIPYGPVQSLPTSPLAPPSSGENPTTEATPPHAPQRGISYPPLSPKSSLKRGMALQQQSCSIKLASDGITIPVITGVPTPNEDEDDPDALEDKAITTQPMMISNNEEKPQRKGRMERADARRYHTAGAIEDIKKQDVKDASIQKRLSWNYGQHIANHELTLQQKKNNTKCLSSDSMHSSSGVSSTGSLHLSIGGSSEFEDSTASTGTVVTATHIYRNLSSSNASSSKEENVPDPSSMGQLQQQQSGGGSSLNLSVNNEKSKAGCPPPVPPRTNQSHHVTTTYITQDEVTVTSSSSTVAAVDPTKKKTEIHKLREMLLSDNSVESSNV